MIDGVAVPGWYFPAAIAFRSIPASCMYALGSDSSPIDMVVQYSIGKVANRNASTIVDYRRALPATATLTRMYLWDLVGPDTSAGSLCSGLGDDLAAITRAVEPLLAERAGCAARIVEVVPLMSVLHLDAVHVPTGREWLGRRDGHGGARWEARHRSAGLATAAPPAPGGRCGGRRDGACDGRRGGRHHGLTGRARR